MLVGYTIPPKSNNKFMHKLLQDKQKAKILKISKHYDMDTAKDRFMQSVVGLVVGQSSWKLSPLSVTKDGNFIQPF